jgi:hypothetical protein
LVRVHLWLKQKTHRRMAVGLENQQTLKPYLPRRLAARLQAAG